MFRDDAWREPSLPRWRIALAFVVLVCWLAGIGVGLLAGLYGAYTGVFLHHWAEATFWLVLAIGLEMTNDSCKVTVDKLLGKRPWVDPE